MKVSVENVLPKTEKGNFMDITVIGMVKNSADIIESYIRGNGLFADRFAIINNNSTDNTLEILNSLKEEGFRIDIFNDPENARFQSMKMNILIQRVLSMYETDWLIPLDDDEILFAPDGRNVRDVIAGWDRDQAYYLSQRVYLPVESEDDGSEACVPRRITYAFGKKHRVVCKILFSSKIASMDGFLIVQGNHDFVGPEVIKTSQQEIMIAHYPVRSRQQLISKALINWTNYLATPFRKEGNGKHIQRIYEMYKERMTVDDDLLLMSCLQFICDADEGNIEITKQPLEISEEALMVKYTSIDEANALRNYINNTEDIARAYAALLQEKMEKEEM